MNAKKFDTWIRHSPWRRLSALIVCIWISAIIAVAIYAAIEDGMQIYRWTMLGLLLIGVPTGLASIYYGISVATNNSWLVREKADDIYEFREFMSTRGITGIGLPVSSDRRIASIAPGSSADAAGLRAGDEIVAIDGGHVPSDPRGIAIKLSGPRRSEVVVNVKRDGKIISVTLFRQ